MKRPQISTVGGIGTGSGAVVALAALFKGQTIGTIGEAIQAVPLDSAIMVIAGLIVSAVMVFRDDDKVQTGPQKEISDG